MPNVFRYDALAATDSQLQVGGLSKFPVHQRGDCQAVVLFYLQQALYRMVRPLITGAALTEEANARACAAVSSFVVDVYH